MKALISAWAAFGLLLFLPACTATWNGNTVRLAPLGDWRWDFPSRLPEDTRATNGFSAGR